MQISRRRLLLTGGSGLAAAGGPGLAALLAACGRSSGPADTAGGPFAKPQELRSSNGTLEVTLRAAKARVPWGPGTRWAYTYNGTTPGPTLRVRPGDRVTVTLENGLDTMTNLHTHGLHVSPMGTSDEVLSAVDPGARRTYVYEIPANHRSGMFWYHPHAHEQVAPQVSGGLAGAIIVEDDLDELPEIRRSIERVWVLSDPLISSSASDPSLSHMTRMIGREGDHPLVNGVLQPTVTAAAGTLERWRIVNASAARYYRFAVDGHRLVMLATDGGRLGAPAEVDDVLLAPGERVEVAVAPTTSGTYVVRSLPYQRGTAMMGMGKSDALRGGDILLATMVVTGSAAAAALPSRLADDVTTTLPPADASRELVLAMSMGSGGMGGMGGGGGQGMMEFTIDGKLFDPTRTDISTTLGRTEEWTIRNTSTLDHPFHLHVWPFRVVGAPAAVGWKDTVNVPAGGAVTVRVPFIEIPGRTVYHCHILDHEDMGMMGIIDVE